MAGGEGNTPTEEPAEENNFYLDALRTAKNQAIPNARDSVYDGTGDPGATIASDLTGGGWVCTEADNWAEELTSHTSKIMPAFDDAIDLVQTEISAELGRHGGKETVPEGHAHGKAFRTMWGYRHNI
ncbi:MAG: hypothetical protein ABWY50_09640 [Aeromicrobium sp.]